MIRVEAVDEALAAYAAAGLDSPSCGVRITFAAVSNAAELVAALDQAQAKASDAIGAVHIGAGDRAMTLLAAEDFALLVRLAGSAACQRGGRA